MSTGPYKCKTCKKEFLSARSLHQHIKAKHALGNDYDLDVWNKAEESGDPVFVPVTPAGSILMNLAASTEQEAIDNLLVEAAHMPYDGWDSPDGFGFKQRGYEICKTRPTAEGNGQDG